MRLFRQLWVGAIALVAVAAFGAVPATASAPHARPHAGGNLVIVGETGWSSTDPGYPSGIQSGSLLPYNLAYQNLMTFDYTTSQLEPLLATSWTYNAAKTALTLQLRKGVLFQDGTPFNATAAVYNLQRMASPAQNSNCVTFFTSVSSIVATGPYTVTIHFSSAYSALPGILGGMQCAYMASPTAIQTLGAAFAQHPVGTSPWAYSSSVTGSSITFTHFARSWQRAYLNSVTYNVLGDDNSALAAVQSNTAQIFNGTPVNIPAAKQAHLSVEKSLPTGEMWIRLNMTEPPFNNFAARRALAQAIDTNLLARQLFGGQVVPYQTMLTSVSWAFIGSRIHGYPQYSTKVAAADVASLPGGTLNFTMDEGNTPIAVTLAEAIQSELEQIPGITVQLNPLSSPASVAAQHAKTYQALIAQGTSALPDPANVFYRNFLSTSANNQEGFSSAQFDNLVTEAQETFSQAQRKVLYAKAEAILAQQVPMIFLFTLPSTFVMNAHVHGFPPIDSSTMDLSRVWMS